MTRPGRGYPSKPVPANLPTVPTGFAEGGPVLPGRSIRHERDEKEAFVPLDRDPHARVTKAGRWIYHIVRRPSSAGLSPPAQSTGAPTMADLLDRLLASWDPRRFDVIRREAARLGHTVRRARLETNIYRNRWDCSCGMYGIATRPGVARDESIAHLRRAIVAGSPHHG